ncbi:hypothetical protein, partial [Finegoldia magna]|uniref:hypothetical protein n=1 Tax=Finegoldia magna TaxID=1260 RepID=UPI00290DB1B1|nr:hypothetical protein [Finegoldia magna]
FSLIVPKLGYKYLNFQILVIKVYFLKIKKISAHNLSGGADTQNFSYTQITLKKPIDYTRFVFHALI